MPMASIRRLPLVLASASPRRRALLTMIGCPFEVVPAAVDEDAVGSDGGTHPGELVEAVAGRKAEAVVPRFPRRLVLAADTIVVVDGEVLGKPKDADDAVRMLERLSGRWHEVYTGVALARGDSGLMDVRHARTDVRFVSLKPAWIQHYVKTGEPLDKAGAYGIQGRGSMFVAEIRGCYFNVVGLPLAMVAAMLEEAGVSPFACGYNGGPIS